MAKNTGLKINRKYTSPGDPYKDIVWEKRSSKIANPDGSVVFEMNDVEIPSTWSQVATDIMAPMKLVRKDSKDKKKVTGKNIMQFCSFSYYENTIIFNVFVIKKKQTTSNLN